MIRHGWESLYGDIDSEILDEAFAILIIVEMVAQFLHWQHGEVMRGPADAIIDDLQYEIKCPLFLLADDAAHDESIWSCAWAKDEAREINHIVTGGVDDAVKCWTW
ncbi:WD repeat-containing protein 61 [Nymphon striatum]|nr:WD repeat-containing protein 61 [Nymphon striatum]